MPSTTTDETIGVPHPILARQLRAAGLDPASLSDEESWLHDLVRAVSFYYEQLERVRIRLEESLRQAEARVHSLESSVEDLMVASLGRSDDHYHDLFDRSPVPTWEEDFRGVAARLHELRSEGVTDLDAYLADNPEEFCDLVGRIEVTNVNPAAARLVEVQDEVSLLGPLPPDVVDERSRGSFLRQLHAIWHGEESVRAPLLGLRRSGEEFDGVLEWRALKIGGRLDYQRVLVTIVDITKEKAVERQAIESLKNRDEMLASVTHELRTPLAAVMGFAEILRAMDDGDYEDERDNLLGIIASQASDLSDLVEDLLASARSELGQLEIVSVPVDIHAQIAQILESRPEGEREIEVPTRPEQPDLAQGDPQRVRQILRNLITNSLRYGGQRIWIEVASDELSVRVAVLDDGDGLSDDSASRIFDRYFRGEGAESPAGSVGLGLNIARDLATRMGGELVYERRGGSTCFELTLAKRLNEPS